jgi:hypothetical protein
MFWTFKINCNDVPPTPPPSHVCDLGTAFGYNGNKAITLNTLPSAPRWGWYYKLTASEFPLTGDLLVGAGGNNIAAATDVGDFSATLAGGIINVSYSLASGYDLGEVHVYAKCTEPQSVAPGQYGYTQSFPGPSDTQFTHAFNLGTCPYYWLIFHAAINKSFPEGTPCPPRSD